MKWFSKEWAECYIGMLKEFFQFQEEDMKKKVKDHRPGIRVPTAKGSIRFKSKKDYNRKDNKIKSCMCDGVTPCLHEKKEIYEED